MTNTAGIPGDRICSFIERAEHIDEEIKTLNEGKKEVFAEAKGEGFGWLHEGATIACSLFARHSADAAQVVYRPTGPHWLTRAC
jgi:hypothetical protein